MVRILGIAYVGNYAARCFISQGATIASAKKNALVKYKDVQKGLYEYDIATLIQEKFPEFAFEIEKAGRKRIIGISSRIFTKIVESKEFGELIQTAEGKGGISNYHPVSP